MVGYIILFGCILVCLDEVGEVMGRTRSQKALCVDQLAIEPFKSLVLVCYF